MRRYALAFVMLLFGLPLFAQTPDGGWDESLNTAKNAAFLTPTERAVIFEMNKVRSNPKRYAKEVVALMKKQFSDSKHPKAYLSTTGAWIMTQEGIRVVDECIRELSRTKEVGLLLPSRGLSLAARDHVKDQGKTGSIGHTGTDGSSPWDRMGRYGKWLLTCGENIDYGNSEAQAIVLSLLIDDGVPSRGHRNSILNGKYQVAGVSVGPHPSYKFMCTVDYAGGYEDK
jgi:uncharacterized protein YkwD